jgi:hypothetical protein
MIDCSDLSARSHVSIALQFLKYARDALKAAEYPNTLARVRAAIDSCEGALRNQAHRDAFPDRKRIKTPKARNVGARQRQIRADEMRTDPHAADMPCPHWDDVQAAIDAPRDRYGNPLPDARTHVYPDATRTAPHTQFVRGAWRAKRGDE